MQRTKELVLIRHAQSEFNAQGRFSGWIDTPLTTLGKAEARKAGELLADASFSFDVVFTSRLQRARATAELMLEKLKLDRNILIEDWRLNERHYGDLQGRKREDLIASVGENQVWRWRRGYEDRPPSLAITDPRHPMLDDTYSDLDPMYVPDSESLQDTRKRVSEFYYEILERHLLKNERVLVVSHGNTLRALLMELSGMSIKEVESFEVPTSVPIVCAVDMHQQKATWRYLEEQPA